MSWIRRKSQKSKQKHKCSLQTSMFACVESYDVEWAICRDYLKHAIGTSTPCQWPPITRWASDSNTLLCRLGEGYSCWSFAQFALCSLSVTAAYRIFFLCESVTKYAFCFFWHGTFEWRTVLMSDFFKWSQFLFWVNWFHPHESDRLIPIKIKWNRNPTKAQCAMIRWVNQNTCDAWSTIKRID